MKTVERYLCFVINKPKKQKFNTAWLCWTKEGGGITGNVFHWSPDGRRGENYILV